MEALSLYLHIPFCQHRCGYCDFNTYAGLAHLQTDYVAALGREAEFLARLAGEALPLKTIYFGGGTPSLLTVEQLAYLMAVVNSAFAIQPDAEITLEANPGTVDLPYLAAVRALGFNRISLGVQSAQPDELRLLERQHGYPEAIEAVAAARNAGFDNLSLDLIFGLPYQRQAAWQENVELVASLDPEHLSLYALTVEHGTPLEKLVSRGLLPAPDPDAAADMYEWVVDYLHGLGFVQYEISNWAKTDGWGDTLFSRHNVQYWLNQPYIGLGAGAHGFVGGRRTANVLSPAAYIKRNKENERDLEFPRTPATVSAQRIDPQTEMSETMMMGLRLLDVGVSRARFAGRFGVQLEEVYGSQIKRLIGQGLLQWGGPDGDTLQLTEGGRLLGNQVFVEFV